MDRDEQFEPQAVTKASIDKVLDSQQPLAVAEVARLRRVHPDKSPAELATFLNRNYLRLVRRIGTAAGFAAMDQRAPGNPHVFRQASALHMLCVAEIHRLHPEDFERRIQLLEFVLAGNLLSRAAISEPVMNRTVPHLTKKILDSIPMSAINGANGVLGRQFVTKRGTVRGEFVLVEQLPHVIGGGLGVFGHHLAGCLVIMTAKKILDPPPASWDDPQSGDTDSSP